ncbi:MAG: YqzL family protein [Bacillota bacterium]|nr:YqzL family protein [Bacillota bacterium]HHU62404.1 YqzL family protein [Natronincola sp.]
MILTPQVVWRIFITTGSVSAYLLYKQLLELTQNI